MPETMKERILSLRGQGVLRRSALRIGDGEGVFRRVMGNRQYRHAVEIGTHQGVSAAVLSQFCEKVTTLDVRDWNCRSLWATLNVTNVIFRLVKNDAEKSEVLRDLDFDFAFIDGEHSARGVRLDFDLTRRCGTVLFHDYTRCGVQDKEFVAEFVDSLPADQIKIMGMFALWRSGKPEEVAA